ncbi:hypothetical protein [Clostridium oryzae]|uniref:Uncharacterized protein n=1 Tax=Clostridium oryzae TaxID=1450648 RepID=A0A1V4IID8_9CLOT|nr:hypothetical protein [Clostridium oryzae]OPJ59771.1 hypothetical protein CLORY_31160 [Clostridium oryzae]
MEDGLMAIILTLLLLFCFISGPIYSSFNEEDIYINNYVKVAANNFQNQVRKDGYVDEESYYKLLNQLNATKRIYRIKLVHTSKLIYPKGSDNVQNKYIEHSSKEIFGIIFRNQKYMMRYGDDFSVKITELQEEPSRMLQSSLYSLNGGYNKYLSFKYGGMVENEGV